MGSVPFIMIKMNELLLLYIVINNIFKDCVL